MVNEQYFLLVEKKIIIQILMNKADMKLPFIFIIFTLFFFLLYFILQQSYLFILQIFTRLTKN